jgi:hypothetical protein
MKKKKNKKKKESNNKKIIEFTLLLLLVSILLFLLFTFLLREKNEYDYEHVISHSFVAKDGSYIVFKKDKTFYWYKDKDNLEDNYYYGTYEIYRGENAVEHISSDLALYGVTEAEQRDIIKKQGNKDPIDHYYSWNLYNRKLVTNKETQEIDRDSHFYGMVSDNYKVFYLVNMNASTYATFTLEK